MAKTKTIHICNNCQAQYVRWEGKCGNCGEWNTIVKKEIAKSANSKKSNSESARATIPRPINLISAPQIARYDTPFDSELSRVLGGGIVPGAIMLIGGQPGIGKSTLMLQLACELKHKILYVSGEESPYQIKMRADRIQASNDQCYILNETDLDKVLGICEKDPPDLLMIDSKATDIPVFIIGHITKEGSIAGPKILEHIVDVVLQFEGDRNYVYRILRTIKNRFGSTDEIGIYEMEPQGLRPVTNPSELLLSQGEELISGSSVACTVEGARPLMIETQALVSTAIYGTPQRSATGFDIKRLSMLLAVLEKKCGLYFSQNDVFLNIAGGIKVVDPAIDLAILAALISSLNDIPINKNICFAAEVGLSGEVRSVSRIDQRIQESARLGFKQIIISKYHKKIKKDSYEQIEVIGIGKVEELMSILFS